MTDERKGFSWTYEREDSIRTQDALRKEIRKQLMGIIEWEIPNDARLEALV